MDVLALRQKLALSQSELGERLGVSQVTVSRWENGHNQPSQLFLARLRSLAQSVVGSTPPPAAQPEAPRRGADFLGDPGAVQLVAEAERLSHAHLFNPAFAIEASLVDPLPHQRIAVYEHLLPEDRLRFLLADDAGAGKTIMAGLYLREMLSRRKVRRILIAPPAGLIGNWRRELSRFFRLDFRIVRGADAKDENPFLGPAGDQVIVSIDTLASRRVFGRLAESGVEPYDLVIFDEAHKLAANRRDDLRIDKTDRYRVAEALAGARPADPEYRLAWSAMHLLLLTATPHMGKDMPYYYLWRLLEPEILTTYEAFRAMAPELRGDRFLRRLKEEMVHADGRPLYTARSSETPQYALESGPDGEQELYDRATDYLRHLYQRAAILNRQAARLVLGVYQRRLASSTYAFLCSLERHEQKLEEALQRLRSGELTELELKRLLREAKLDADPFGAPADEEGDDDEGTEFHERAELKLIESVVVGSLVELEAELRTVRELRDLGRRVLAKSRGVKFEQLLSLLRHPGAEKEKLLVFTEHRDTLTWLTHELEGLGFRDRIASIHGGMDYRIREEQVEQFRRDDGAQVLLATDAAGEGINLQFCWRMVNWDIPWNPARLEQRMGRIHRYGQKRNVLIVNLVADGTREAKVLRTLLEKLELIRKELHSDKVFDVLGRLLSNIDLGALMSRALLGSAKEDPASEVADKLEASQVRQIESEESKLYGRAGDVAKELPRLREELSIEAYRRLLPGYLRSFLERAAPALGLSIVGDLDGEFSLQPARAGDFGPLWAALESYPSEARARLMLRRPESGIDAIFLHPEEPVFRAVTTMLRERFAAAALQGAVFVDPEASEPYLLHVAGASWHAAGESKSSSGNALATRLVAVRHRRERDRSGFELSPVERLLLLQPAQRFPVEQAGFASEAEEWVERAANYLDEALLVPYREELRARARAQALARDEQVRRGFASREAELAQRRSRLRERAEAGDRQAVEELEAVRREQQALGAERQQHLDHLHAGPEQIVASPLRWIARALVVPTRDAEELERHDRNAEAVAMAIVRAVEEARGATVIDVSTPPKARAANLTDYPGFDLLVRPPGGGDLAVEVKGRLGRGDVEMKVNEWSAAVNRGDGYHLAVVLDCATPKPNLYRIVNPFDRLLAKQTGALRIPLSEIVQKSEETRA